MWVSLEFSDFAAGAAGTPVGFLCSKTALRRHSSRVAWSCDCDTRERLRLARTLFSEGVTDTRAFGSQSHLCEWIWTIALVRSLISRRNGWVAVFPELNQKPSIRQVIERVKLMP